MPSIAETNAFNVASDAADEVNILKPSNCTADSDSETAPWDGESVFDKGKEKPAFRRYNEACDRVKVFYREQHEKQTYEFNVRVRQEFDNRVRKQMGIWEAMEELSNLVDSSDPDTTVSQIEHLLQTAEAIRRDGKPEWMQVTGLIHDLGKLWAFYGSQTEREWDVVGDTFVVGCKFSEKIIYPETFENNPDLKDPMYSTEYGVYKPNCGLDNVMLSWGHDEYLYRVLKENQCDLPDQGLYMIRYHSFYPWHTEGAYKHLCNEADEEALKAVKAFNPYDLYSKSDEPVDPERLKPYYKGLIAKFFPPVLNW